MSKFKLLQPAARGLEVAVAFYGDQASKLGFTFLDEFERAVELICAMPEAWSPVDRKIRRFLLRRFPYSVLYSKEENTIIIISVFDQRRKPNSWRRNR